MFLTLDSVTFELILTFNIALAFDEIKLWGKKKDQPFEKWIAN